MGNLEDYKHITTTEKSITCLTVLLSHAGIWGFFWLSFILQDFYIDPA